MKRITALIAIFATILLRGLSPSIILSQERPCSWEVYFSSHGGAIDAVIRKSRKAKATVLVQAYSFTSAPIARALLAYKKNWQGHERHSEVYARRGT